MIRFIEFVIMVVIVLDMFCSVGSVNSIDDINITIRNDTRDTVRCAVNELVANK